MPELVLAPVAAELAAYGRLRESVADSAEPTSAAPVPGCIAYLGQDRGVTVEELGSESG